MCTLTELRIARANLLLDIAESSRGTYVGERSQWETIRKWSSASDLTTTITIHRPNADPSRHIVGFRFLSADSAVISGIIGGALPHGLQISEDGWRQVNSHLESHAKELAHKCLQQCISERHNLHKLRQRRVISAYRHEVELKANSRRTLHAIAQIEGSGSAEARPLHGRHQ